MKKQLLILACLFTFIIGHSQIIGDTFVDNYISYEVTSVSPATVKTTNYNTAGGTVVSIPATVTYNSMIFNVTRIESISFYDKQLTNITIGSNVVNIGTSAFRQNQLTNVIIPDNVITIGNYSFLNNQISIVDFGSGLTNIPEQSFQSNQLTNITLPSNIEAIGWRAFDGNNQLNCVISEATTPPTIITGTGDSFNGSRSNINLTIPTATESAYTTAEWTGFNNVSEGLSNTFVVDNITYQVNTSATNEVAISDYNTAGGTVVNIPATVTSSCTQYNVTKISAQAFQGNGLTGVTIPNSVTTISSYAFFQNALTTVDLPSGLTQIELGVFENNNLASIVIPNGVVSISVGAFKNNSLASVILPNSLTSISQQAFRQNSLTTVTIPENVTSIGNTVFRNNPLTDVYSLSDVPPTITTGGFSDSFTTDRSTIHLHIPGGTAVMDAYVNDSGALWTGFNPVTQDALGVSDFELNNNVNIITANNQISVTYNNSIRLKNYTLYSITGAKVKEGAESTVNIESLSNGIYLLKLDFDKGIVVRKIAK